MLGRPNYSPPVSASLRRTISTIEPQGELDEVDVPISDDIDNIASE